MRRTIGTTLILGILALPLGFLTGCGETSSSSVEVKSPGGGKDKVEVKETKTGDMKDNK